MPEARVHRYIIFQPQGRKPMAKPYPQVYFASRKELRDQISAALRRYWPAATRINIEVRGNWRSATGVALFRPTAGSPWLEVNFLPASAGAKAQDHTQNTLEV